MLNGPAPLALVAPIRPVIALLLTTALDRLNCKGLPSGDRQPVNCSLESHQVATTPQSNGAGEQQEQNSGKGASQDGPELVELCRQSQKNLAEGVALPGRSEKKPRSAISSIGN